MSSELAMQYRDKTGQPAYDGTKCGVSIRYVQWLEALARPDSPVATVGEGLREGLREWLGRQQYRTHMGIVTRRVDIPIADVIGKIDALAGDGSGGVGYGAHCE